MCLGEKLGEELVHEKAEEEKERGTFIKVGEVWMSRSEVTKESLMKVVGKFVAEKKAEALANIEKDANSC